MESRNLKYLKSLFREYEDQQSQLYQLQKNLLKTPILINPHDYEYFKEYCSKFLSCSIYFHIGVDKKKITNTLRNYSLLDLLIFSSDRFKIQLVSKKLKLKNKVFYFSAKEFLRTRFDHTLEKLVSAEGEKAKSYLWLISLEEPEKENLRTYLEEKEFIYSSNQYINQVFKVQEVLRPLIEKVLAYPEVLEHKTLLITRAQLWGIELSGITHIKDSKKIDSYLQKKTGILPALDLGIKNVMLLEQFKAIITNPNYSNSELLQAAKDSCEHFQNKIEYAKEKNELLWEKNIQILNMLDLKS